MPRKYVFADESGNFDFSRSSGASKYFILTTITARDCSVGNALMDLRRELAWEGERLASDEFHATTDEQRIRDRVFAVLAGQHFRLDATILEKAKAQAQVRSDDERFYKIAWFYHLKYLAPRIATSNDELLVVGASMGTKAKRKLFHLAVQDVVWQVAPTLRYQVAYWSDASEPCLQAADYCSWALQRKWERSDPRSYDLIKDKVVTEFDLWATGSTRHY